MTATWSSTSPRSTRRDGCSRRAAAAGHERGIRVRAGAHRIGLWLRREVLDRVLFHGRPVVCALALVWRRLLFRTTFVAITGSLGKTTAKDAWPRAWPRDTGPRAFPSTRTTTGGSRSASCVSDRGTAMPCSRSRGRARPHGGPDTLRPARRVDRARHRAHAYRCLSHARGVRGGEEPPGPGAPPGRPRGAERRRSPRRGDGAPGRRGHGPVRHACGRRRARRGHRHTLAGALLASREL